MLGDILKGILKGVNTADKWAGTINNALDGRGAYTQGESEEGDPQEDDFVSFLDSVVHKNKTHQAGAFENPVNGVRRRGIEDMIKMWG